MANGEPQKVVQIPEDTFRKMREKLKKQDERIKTLENQLINTELEKDGKPAEGSASPEILEQLNSRIKELEILSDDQKKQIEQLASRPDSGSAATGKEYEEKEELIKYLMEREKQLLEALENKPATSSTGSSTPHLEKGLQLLQKFEHEMSKRSAVLDTLFTQVTKMKEAMNRLEQELLAIPTKEDLDNRLKELVATEPPVPDVPGLPVSYETILERIKNQLGKSIELKERIFQEHETIARQKKGLTQRIDFLASSFDNINGNIKEKEDRLNSAREYFEAKYLEWKAQDEARAREMESLWGMIGTD